MVLSLQVASGQHVAGEEVFVVQGVSAVVVDEAPLVLLDVEQPGDLGGAEDALGGPGDLARIDQLAGQGRPRVAGRHRGGGPPGPARRESERLLLTPSCTNRQPPGRLAVGASVSWSGAAKCGERMKISPIDDELTRSTLNVFGRAAINHLLEELFPGRTEILFQALMPGMSGSSVLLAYPHAPQRQEPCVVKVGPARDIAAELEAYKTHVEPYLRSENLPGIIGSYVRDDLGALAFQFYAKTTLNARLEQLASEGNAKTVTALVRNLLKTLASAWNVSKVLRRRDLFVADYQLGSADLSAFEQLCLSMPHGHGVSPEDAGLVRWLWTEGGASFNPDHYISLCHGDLYGDNVLVNPQDRFCLIDFSHAKPQHYLRDFITLEGDLVLRLFPSGDREELQGAASVLRRLIEASSPPFPGPSGRFRRKRSEDPVAAPILAALAEIRAAAWGRMENDRAQIPPYELGLIRRLVRTTVRPENRLSDSQRWAGVHLTLAHARHLTETVSPGRKASVASSPKGLASDKRSRPAEQTLEREPPLATKVKQARERESPCFTLIGGVYLDVILKPIETLELRQEEWSNLEPVRLCLGGSCIQVGRAVEEHFQVHSVLLSAIGGAADPMSTEARRLLDREPWMANSSKNEIAGVSTAVSVHLRQGSGEFTTIFTHRGALEFLGWPRIAQESLEAYESGGILYIAGYFRTCLHSQLEEHLRMLGHAQVVALDHGRLVPEVESPQAVRALKQAFRQGLVDVYICTLSELWSLVAYPDRQGPLSSAVQSADFLRDLVAEVQLPPVTIIRDEEWLGRSTAWLLYSPTESIEAITVPSSWDPPRGAVGMDNAFNAVFLHSLATGPSGQGLWEAVKQATIDGVTAWRQVAR